MAGLLFVFLDTLGASYQSRAVAGRRLALDARATRALSEARNLPMGDTQGAPETTDDGYVLQVKTTVAAVAGYSTTDCRQVTILVIISRTSGEELSRIVRSERISDSL